MLFALIRLFCPEMIEEDVPAGKQKSLETMMAELDQAHNEEFGNVQTPLCICGVSNCPDEAIHTAQRNAYRELLRMYLHVRNPSGDDVYFTSCGHAHKASCEIYFGDRKIRDLSVRSEMIINGSISGGLCFDCYVAHQAESSVLCADCARLIFPGQAVALYPIEDVLPEWAFRIGDHVVGCTHLECCPSAGFLSGHWTESGFKPLQFHKKG